MHHIAIEYIKKALTYAYYLDDYLSEVIYYEKLAICHMDISSPYIMMRYYERSFQNITEEDNSVIRIGARTHVERKKKLLD